MPRLLLRRALRRASSQAGRCNICGRNTSFLYDDPALFRETLACIHCGSSSRYRSIARGILRAVRELRGIDATSIAELRKVRSAKPLRVYDTQQPFAAGAVAYPVPKLLARCSWIELAISTLRSGTSLGAAVAARTTNQDLERLTFADASFDVVITSDVMEHVRVDARAHAEIRRVLAPGGVYLFTVPSYRTGPTFLRVVVVDPDDPSRDYDAVEREYHGDVNSEEGRALAYRVYGTDLDDALARLGFTVEYSGEDFPAQGIRATELFYCRVTGGDR